MVKFLRLVPVMLKPAKSIWRVEERRGEERRREEKRRDVQLKSFTVDRSN
jgi:hypothetical protein